MAPFDPTATIRRIRWRIVPLCFVLYVISYIDRANIGYAALQMNAELHLGSEAFGFAAGIFFIGYFLCEVPSNMLLLRYGARIWIARILITWGIISMATAFVTTDWQLYVVRFLLGVAEAGFFPAIIVYFSNWFRDQERATVISYFTAAIPVSYVLGAPLSTAIMQHISAFGISGWRWMFIIEGAPAVIGGLITYWVLVDRPSEARWLSAEERSWLDSELKAEDERGGHKSLSIFRAIADPRILFLSAIYFVYQSGSLGVGYWMPQVIKGLSVSSSLVQIGLLSTAPYVVATIGMVLWSRHSDTTGERKMHAAWPLLCAGIALCLIPSFKSVWPSLSLLAVALTGFYAFKSPFWTLPTLFLSRETAAISVAAINSIGNLGGFFGPYMVGFVAESYSQQTGLMFLGALTLVSFLMTLIARRGLR